MDTRREFFKKSVLLSGAAGLAQVIPPAIQKALAIDPDPGSSYLDAEHVVILMQENRSFDHCFGTLKGVRGFNDPRALLLANKNKVWLQKDKKGDTYAPFRFDIQHTKITWMGATPHYRSSQVDAYNGGKYDTWIDAKGTPLTMGHYTREDIPFNYAMADAFTLCDQHFCSAMTSTWPNRLFMWGGTIRSEKNDKAKAYIRNDIPYGEARWKTFPERLEENNIAWKVYQNEIWSDDALSGEEKSWLSNFGCNTLEWLSQYNGRFLPGYRRSLQQRKSLLTEEIKQVKNKLERLSQEDKSFAKLHKILVKKSEVLQETEQELLKWTSHNFEQLSKHEKNLFHKAFTTNKEDPDYHSLTSLKFQDDDKERELLIPKGDILYQFRKDVEKDQLPVVSWIVPPQNFSDHPSAPWYGAWLTSEILDILTQRPEVWKKTIFILTYDENDGYFDHVPPFLPPDTQDQRTGKCSKGIDTAGEYIRKEQEIKEGISPKHARSGPIGLGYRVPLIIASPWTRGGKVCSQVFDHTSSLQFLEEFLNNKFKTSIKQEEISEWRRTVCGNLLSAFDTWQPSPSDSLSFLSRTPFIEKIYNSKFEKAPSNYAPLSPAQIRNVNERSSSSSALLPGQEPGFRAASALPYELYADGLLNKERGEFELRMKAGKEIFGNRSAGAPFTVYAGKNYVSLETEASTEKQFDPMRVWHYAAKAGDAVADKWLLSNFEDKNYHLSLYGPNGFFRLYAGNESDPLIEATLRYQEKRGLKKGLTGNIELHLWNRDNLNPAVIEITDNAYKGPAVRRTIKANSRLVLPIDLKKSLRWYDIALRIQGSAAYERRFAGRVENGEKGYSDPALG